MALYNLACMFVTWFICVLVPHHVNEAFNCYIQSFWRNLELVGGQISNRRQCIFTMARKFTNVLRNSKQTFTYAFGVI